VNVAHFCFGITICEFRIWVCLEFGIFPWLDWEGIILRDDLDDVLFSIIFFVV
jgi:hypothetical protein